jgi:hypothetical protein
MVRVSALAAAELRRRAAESGLTIVEEIDALVFPSGTVTPTLESRPGDQWRPPVVPPVEKTTRGEGEESESRRRYVPWVDPA